MTALGERAHHFEKYKVPARFALSSLVRLVDPAHIFAQISFRILEI
jgi:hypothetical protein